MLIAGADPSEVPLTRAERRLAPATAPRRLPTVVVGADAFYDCELIARHFADDALVRYEDLSSPARVAAATRDAEAVVVAMHRLTAETIEAMSASVRVIGRTGVGVDTVDLDAAARCGITVFNEPDYGSGEVATHALAMLLMLARYLQTADRFVRSGDRAGLSVGSARPLDELTAGVVGCGRIGAKTALALGPLVGDVLVLDPLQPELPDGARRAERLDELLEQANALLLHVPLTAQTAGMIGRRELSVLPDGAFVVNVSRGGLIDEEALADELVAGRLGGAGLDVFADEPLPARSPLRQAPKTVLSPHCASYSSRAAWRLGTWTIGDALSFLGRSELEHGSIVVAGKR